MVSTELQALLEPISSSSPTGQDAKYEFCYEVMESEIKKFGSLFGETVDWLVVDKTSTEVLLSYSKDLKPLCYLVRSMVERNKFVGLRDGLELLLSAISTFSNELYPRRKRGRDGVLDWLLDQLDAVLPKIEVKDEEQLIIIESVDLAKSISSALFSVFEDTDVNFNRLANMLSARVLTADVMDDVNVDQAQVDVSRANLSDKAKIPTVVTPLAMSNPEPDIDFSTGSTLKTSLGTLSHYLLSNHAGFGLAYRINRYVTWCDVDEIPCSNDDNITLLSLAISTDKCAEYQKSVSDSPTVELIKQLEKTLINSPFWLTGHFIQYQALIALNYVNAANAIKSELQDFVAKFKGITALKFSNDIPFADIENIGSFIFEISKSLDNDDSGRGQFINYLQIIKVYQSAGLYHLCLPYIEKIWPIRCEMNLVSWEPVLCTQLDYLVRLTLTNIYEKSEDIPDKYQEWKS